MVGHIFRIDDGLIKRFDIADVRLPRFKLNMTADREASL